MRQATREKAWIDGAEAARILDLPKLANVQRLVEEGLIGVRKLPGTREVFRREDVVNLAKLNERPVPVAEGTPPAGSGASEKV